MAVERNLVADLGFLVVYPRIRRMGQHFAFEVGGDVITERHILGVAQRGIRHRLALAFALAAQNHFARRVALGALDGDGVVAEVFVPENAADRHTVAGGFLELTKQARDVLDVFRAEFFALAAEALAHLLPEAASVDQLQLAFAGGGLAVADDPDIGADAGVVEHVCGQSDDGLDQVVFQHIAANIALAGTCAAGEQRRAIEHDAEAAAAIHSEAHLGDQVQQKQQRAVADTRQSGAEAAVETHLLGFLTDNGFDLLPLHTEGRIGEAVVKELARQTVV